MVRPLPGVSFETVPPALANRLPRMDVAAFVGFAAAGPLHTPVVVEDEVHFRRIFGDDQALAWDEAAGTVQRSHLGPAVRAFFRNGGRRCWVVRVAADTATSNRYLLPGLMRFTQETSYRPALVQARSEGSWSDGLRTATVLTTEPFDLLKYGLEGDDLAIELSRLSRRRLEPGDLLRLRFPMAILYLAVDAVAAEGQAWQVRGREFWFQPEPVLGAPPATAEVWVRPATGPRRRLADALWVAPSRVGGEHRVYLPGGSDPGAGGIPPGPGALLELSADGTTLLLSVSESRPATDAEKTQLGLGSGTWTALAGRDPLGLISHQEGRNLANHAHATEILVERLTFELWVADGEAQPFRLTGLGFCPGHPRYLNDLPTDRELFGFGAEEVQPRPDGPRPGQGIRPAVLDPRFPLAGMAEDAPIYLPVGMDWQVRLDSFALPEPQIADPPVRDGLAAFDPGVFLDPDLADLSSDALREGLFHKRYILGRPLRGLHAIWPLDEVTLIALPDAIHTPWAEVDTPTVYPLQAPVLTLHDGQLAWNGVAGAEGYTVQQAWDPAFAGPVQSSAQAERSQALPPATGCRDVRYYRVRARRLDENGPWSNTLRVVLQASDFAPCVQDVVEAPTLADPVALGENRFTLTWAGGSPGATYVVEEAGDPDFFGSRELYAGPETAVALVRMGEQPAYYRVRAVVGEQMSPWSNTVWLLQVSPRRRLKLQPALADPEDSLRIHEAALRFALARGDLLTVLTVPGHYREQEVIAYTRSLVARLGSTEERALTYGALYHPWLWMQEGAGATRLMPPDGAVLGRMARRALERGAWVAPANENLEGAVALAPPLGPGVWQLFADSQVNLVQRDARGFLVLSADTLSTDDSLRLINVRRLLILLRRLAQREGASLVFQPNDDSFRRLVQRRFEALLGDLHRRGAFAGGSADEAFQVVTDGSVNPRESVEAGRFVVELRVAPSKPLAFLRVRLVQSQGAGTAFEEV